MKRAQRRRALGAIVTAGALTAVVLNAVPAAAGQPCDDSNLIQLLANGHGAKSAELIARCGYANDGGRLGDLIYYAGVEAEENDQVGPYSDAVATAFVDGGVPVHVAQVAFATGGLTAARSGLTPGQAIAGGVVIAKTEAAYLAALGKTPQLSQ